MNLPSAWLPRWLVALALLVSAGCGSSAPRRIAGAAPCAPPCQLGSGSMRVSAFVEPEAGAAPILSALATATTSIDVEVYELSDTRIIHGLEDARNRGVVVRVLLELAPFGDASVAARITAEELITAGVQVEGGSPAFRYTHAKVIVIDRATAYILTANLTHAGLGGSAASANRDYGVIDSDPTDVAGINAIFAADWSRTTAHPLAANLIVSPDNARAKLLSLIGRAQHSLYIEDEELQDNAVVAALSDAARRGVVVEVVLPAPGSGGPPAPRLRVLSQTHVAVRYSGHLYMHAKLMLVDGAQAFVGSVNFSATSLDANREIGVLAAEPTALNLLATTFAADWRTGSPA